MVTSVGDIVPPLRQNCQKKSSKMVVVVVVAYAADPLRWRFFHSNE